MALKDYQITLKEQEKIQQKVLAFDLFMAGNNATDIAKKVGVSVPTIYAWQKEERWTQKIQELASLAVDQKITLTHQDIEVNLPKIKDLLLAAKSLFYKSVKYLIADAQITNTPEAMKGMSYAITLLERYGLFKPVIALDEGSGLGVAFDNDGRFEELALQTLGVLADREKIKLGIKAYETINSATTKPKQLPENLSSTGTIITSTPDIDIIETSDGVITLKEKPRGGE